MNIIMYNFFFFLIIIKLYFILLMIILRNKTINVFLLKINSLKKQKINKKLKKK